MPAAPTPWTLSHHANIPMFPPVVVDRSMTYLGRVVDNHVVVPTRNVSRRHAKLVIEEGTATIHDLDSHNGVFVNGKKVRSAILRAGDLLYLADVCLELSGGGKPIAKLPATEPRALGRAITDVIALAHGPAGWEASALEQLGQLLDASGTVWCERRGNEWHPASGRPPLPALVKPWLANLGNHVVVDVDGGLGGVAMVAAPVMNREQVTAAVIAWRDPPAPAFNAAHAGLASVVAALAGRSASEGAAPTGAAWTTLQAKQQALELRAGELHHEARSATERIHTLEGDNLKLRQQIDVERQSSHQLGRDLERERAAMVSLEASVDALSRNGDELLRQRGDNDRLARDGERMQDELQRRSQEHERDKRLADDERKALLIDLERQRQWVLDADQRLEQERTAQELVVADWRSRISDLEREAGQLPVITSQARVLSAELEGLRARMGDDARELKAAQAVVSALRLTVPPTLVAYVEDVAQQRSLPPSPSFATTERTYLVATLEGFDGWAASAPSAEVQQRLQDYGNAFPAALAAHRAGDGRIEQVLGHVYALSFLADATGVAAALACGERLLAADAHMVVAIHVGPSLQGLVGAQGAAAWPAEDATAAHASVGFVDGGAGLALARSLVDSAPRSGMVVVTDRVRSLVAPADHSQWPSLGSTYVRSLQAIVTTYAATMLGLPTSGQR